MLNENHEPVSGFNLDSGLSVSFSLNNLSDSVSDGRGSILSEDSARVISVPVVIVSRSGPRRVMRQREQKK